MALKITASVSDVMKDWSKLMAHFKKLPEGMQYALVVRVKTKTPNDVLFYPK